MISIVFALAFLADPPPAKPKPSISWEQRSAFWRAQNTLVSAQKGLNSVVDALRTTCGADPVINPQGEPDCPEAPPQQPPVPPAKKSGTQ